MEKTKQKQRQRSQPRMRLDLPPGGFLREPVALLAPPDGAGDCCVSLCSSCSASSSSGQSPPMKQTRSFQMNSAAFLKIKAPL